MKKQSQEYYQPYPQSDPDHVRKSCQPFIDHLIEEDRKKALARKAEAERLANDPKFAEIAIQDRTRKKPS